jgi:hypothetical protein
MLGDPLRVVTQHLSLVTGSWLKQKFRRQGSIHCHGASTVTGTVTFSCGGSVSKLASRLTVDAVETEDCAMAQLPLGRCQV